MVRPCLLRSVPILLLRLRAHGDFSLLLRLRAHGALTLVPSLYLALCTLDLLSRYAHASCPLDEDKDDESAQRQSGVTDGKNLHAVYDDVARVYESHPGCVSCTVVKVSPPRCGALADCAVSISCCVALCARCAVYSHTSLAHTRSALLPL